MSAIQIFQFKGHSVRVAVADPERPEWVGLDACHALQIRNSRHALSRLPDDERGCVVIDDAMGRPRETTTITEAGLYRLIMSSRTDNAVEFQRFVYHEVLPSIRKTGGYGGPAVPALDLAAVAGAVAAILLPQVKALLGSPVEARATVTKGQAEEIRAGLRWLAVQLHRGAPTTTLAGWRSKRDLRLRNRVDYPRGPGNGWDNLPACKLDQVRRALDEMRADVADLVNPARQLRLTSTEAM